MTVYLDMDELAAMMGIDAKTMRRNLRSRPYEVPPRMHVPSSKMMRWRRYEVEKWLYEQGFSLT